MTLAKQISKHFRDVFFGGNWTVSCMQEQLKDVSWQQATTKVHSFNTIAALTYNSYYFVLALLDVLEGKPLTAHDKFSFNHPQIQSQQDWEDLLNKIWIDVERTTLLIEQLPNNKLSENFADAKYGTYYRNITGIIEHTHYHLGQIVIIKKMLNK
ncbi:MAG: DUF1572 domain-containing protein [Bacteroidetes bacterium]|nr:DUF1572 domain-containing protein [Bacteroidota bacterium]